MNGELRKETKHDFAKTRTRQSKAKKKAKTKKPKKQKNNNNNNKTQSNKQKARKQTNKTKADNIKSEQNKTRRADRGEIFDYSLFRFNAVVYCLVSVNVSFDVCRLP